MKSTDIQLILLCLILSIYCQAQKVENFLKGTEFEKHQLNTNGANQKSIPLVSIQSDHLSLGLELNYYLGGGVPVEELSSNVGLGWRLNGISFITRTVQGIPDEGYLRKDNLDLTDNSGDEIEIEKHVKGWIQDPKTNTTNGDDLWLMTMGVLDNQPDIFSYSAGSYSGSFYFDFDDENNLIVVNMNMNNVLIEPVIDYENPIDDQSAISNLEFKITTPDGIEYLYGGTDNNGTRLEEKSSARGAGVVNVENVALNTAVTNTWMINTISSLIIPDDIINFQYRKEAYSYISLGNERLMMKHDGLISDDQNFFGETNKVFHQPRYHYFSKEQAMRHLAGATGGSVQNSLYNIPSSFTTNFINSLAPETINTKYEQVVFYYTPIARKDVFTDEFEDKDGNPVSIEGLISPTSSNQYKPFVLGGLNHQRRETLATTYVPFKRFTFSSSYYINHLGNGVSRYTYEYDDTKNTSWNVNSASESITTVDCNRLMLTGVSEIGANNRNLNTDFDYQLDGFGSSEQLPRRLSFSTDYWGFHNGDFGADNTKDGLIHNVPQLPFETQGRPFLIYETDYGPNPFTADRTPKWPEMTAGLLTKVNNIFGSSEHFEYEPNTVNNYPMNYIKDCNLTINGVDYTNVVGGLRLKRKMVYDSEVQNPSLMLSVNYTYGHSEDMTKSTSGRLLYSPVFVELFGQDMKVHDGNYLGNDEDALCDQKRTMIVRGAINSKMITPRVGGSSHMAYEFIQTEIDKGKVDQKFNVMTDDELAGNTQAETVIFGTARYRAASSIGNVLKRGSILALTYQDDAGQKKAEETYQYNTATRSKQLVSVRNEYAGMPFDNDSKWYEGFTAQLGASLTSPVRIGYYDVDISNSPGCEAAMISSNQFGGANNILVNTQMPLYSGRVEPKSKRTEKDGVAVITDYQYEDFDVSHNQQAKSIHTLKRVFTYNELDPTERQVQVMQYAGERAFSDPSFIYYQDTSPLIKNKPTPSALNTVDLMKSRYLHTPMGQQQWFNYYNDAGEVIDAQQVSGTFSTMVFKFLSNNLVNECTYQFMGNRWDMISRSSEWNSNGTPKKTYQAYIGTNYYDENGNLIEINEDDYNLNYTFTDIQDGLPLESYIYSPTDIINRKFYAYYNNRLPKTETSIKGNNIVYDGTHYIYDALNRIQTTYTGATVFDGSGIPTKYKQKTTHNYLLKGMGDGENSKSKTIDYYNENITLQSLEETVDLDDLGRQLGIVQSNINPNTSDSYVLKTNTYDDYGKLYSTYDIGKDTKRIIYEDSPLNREQSILSLQAVDDEKVDLEYSSNLSSDFIGIPANLFFKTEVTDIDLRTATTFTDYAGRVVTERRINDSGNFSDTRQHYDAKGKLMTIKPPSGPHYSYTYNNRGLLATKSVPHGGTSSYYYDELLRLVLEVDANLNKLVTIYDDFHRIVKTGLKSAAYDQPDSINDFFDVGELDLGDAADIVLSEILYSLGTSNVYEEKLTVLDPDTAQPNQTLSTFNLSYDEALGLPLAVVKDNILGGQDIFSYKYNDLGQIYYSLQLHKKPGDTDRFFQQKVYFDHMNRPWKSYMAFENNEARDGQLISEIGYDEYSRIVKKKLHEVAQDEYLQEVDFTYDDFGRIIKINDHSTMYDSQICAAEMYCVYEAIVESETDIFTFDEIYFDQVLKFDLSMFTLSSTSDLLTASNDMLLEIQTQVAAGQDGGPLPEFIIDDLTIKISQKDNGNYQMVLGYWQTNYEFECVIVNGKRQHLGRKDCCGNVGPSSDKNDLYWQELSYQKLVNEQGQDVLKNSTNIHRKSYGYSCGNSKNYSYQYDALNRLNIAFYYEGFAANFTTLPDIDNGLQGDYSVQIDYNNDLGDIESIYRFAPGNNGSHNGTDWDLYDAISFSYDSDNELTHTTENGDKLRGHKSINQDGLNNYTYDNNGNLISDTGKGITDIAYTYFNLPAIISKGTINRLNFVYDGNGAQLQKLRKEGTIVQSTKSYIGNIEYNGKTIEDSQFESYYHSDGLIKLNLNGDYEYHYYLKDHLGNNVVLFCDENDSGFIERFEVIQQNEYYPFGAKMTKSGTSESEEDNQYQYNGKEMHRELDLNMYAYGARFYDPNIARFTGVDPIADQFAFVSVFNYAENNPIGFIDLHGLQQQRSSYSSVVSNTLVYDPNTGNEFNIVQHSETVINHNITKNGSYKETTTTTIISIVYNNGSVASTVGEVTSRTFAKSHTLKSGVTIKNFNMGASKTAIDNPEPTKEILKVASIIKNYKNASSGQVHPNYEVNNPSFKLRVQSENRGPDWDRAAFAALKLKVPLIGKALNILSLTAAFNSKRPIDLGVRNTAFFRTRHRSGGIDPRENTSSIMDLNNGNPGRLFKYLDPEFQEGYKPGNRGFWEVINDQFSRSLLHRSYN